jgi:hypothetical protein
VARLEVDVARRGVVRVSHEQVQVAHHRRLIREVADIRGLVVIARVDTGELDRALGGRGQPLDKALDFSGRCSSARTGRW